MGKATSKADDAKMRLRGLAKVLASTRFLASHISTNIISVQPQHTTNLDGVKMVPFASPKIGNLADVHIVCQSQDRDPLGQEQGRSQKAVGGVEDRAGTTTDTEDCWWQSIETHKNVRITCYICSSWI